MKNKIIAVDFDGTLCENRYPEIGEPNEELIKYLIKRQADGDKLILWTCRCGDILEQAVNWCHDHGLVFDAVNDNLPSSIEWANGCNSRKIYADKYIDDKNVSVASCIEKSEMELWAEREVSIACERERHKRTYSDFDYVCSCYKSALKAFKSLLEDGYSGCGINITKNVLNRLIGNKPLSTIEDADTFISSVDTSTNDDVIPMMTAKIENLWNYSNTESSTGAKIYQCRRMFSLYKYVYPDGTIKYRDIYRFIGVNIRTNKTYINKLIYKIGEEIAPPITMPYMPESNSWYFYTIDYLTDRNNGDFDTIAVSYVIDPIGNHVWGARKYFKVVDSDYVEISANEYRERIAMHYARIKNERGY